MNGKLFFFFFFFGRVFFSFPALLGRVTREDVVTLLGYDVRAPWRRSIMDDHSTGSCTRTWFHEQGLEAV